MATGVSADTADTKMHPVKKEKVRYNLLHRTAHRTPHCVAPFAAAFVDGQPEARYRLFGVHEDRGLLPQVPHGAEARRYVRGQWQGAEAR